MPANLDAPDSLPGLRLGLDAAWQDPASFPFHFKLPVRYSDLDHGQISRVALGHFFEDLRSLVASELVGYGAQLGWRALLRSVALESLAPEVLEADTQVEIAGGISGIGRSSSRTAMAVFQQGRCIALGEATNVTVGENHRPEPIEPARRDALHRGLLAASDAAAPVAADPIPLAAWKDYPFRLELPARFADTDAVGHLNNVSVSRYHDNTAMAFQRAVLGRHTRPGEPGRWWITRSMVAMAAENFHRAPLCSGAVVGEIGERHFVLDQALFQEGRCTGTAQFVVVRLDADARPMALDHAFQAQLAPWCQPPRNAG